MSESTIERINVIENTTKMICSILIRRLSWDSSGFAILLFFDFLFAIFYLILTRFFKAPAIAFSSSSMVIGLTR